MLSIAVGWVCAAA